MGGFSIAFVLLLLLEPATARTLRFGLVNGGSDFFVPILESFLQKCSELSVECQYQVDVEEGNCTNRLELFREMLALPLDGIAIKPCEKEEFYPLIDDARQRGLPVVTFDSDLPNSTRAAYVGTDQVFLGRTMAKLLRQLRPAGGSFVVLGRKAERIDGFLEEITRYNNKKRWSDWHEVEANFSLDGIETDYMELMKRYALQNPTAMISLIQTPMRHENWTDFVDANRHRNITYIGTDSADYQLDYLQRRYVDGLVGQLPYEIGTEVLQVLYDIVEEGPRQKTIFPTNIVSYNVIPSELPSLDFDGNELDGLKYVGFAFFAVVTLSFLACMVWMYYHRGSVVVRAAQPFFLAMVAGGALLMSSTLIPLSFDDDGDPDSLSLRHRKGICMSIPWLGFIGFTVIFSALFSKTWRVNRLFHADGSFSRVTVTKKDVIAPFAFLLTSNVAVLTCWTILDPLIYVREDSVGTDYWNRVISSYGACRSDHVVAYLAPLAALNAGAVILAGWQAFQARDIKSEFSESFYIGITVFSLFQAFVSGLPVLVIVKDMPEPFYLVLTFMVFFLCMAVLLLIFLPKMLMQRRYAGMSEAGQKNQLTESIKHSSKPSSRRLGDTSSGRMGDSSGRLAGSSGRLADSSGRLADASHNSQHSFGSSVKGQDDGESGALSLSSVHNDKDSLTLKPCTEETPADSM